MEISWMKSGSELLSFRWGLARQRDGAWLKCLITAFLIFMVKPLTLLTLSEILVHFSSNYPHNKRRYLSQMRKATWNFVSQSEEKHFWLLQRRRRNVSAFKIRLWARYQKWQEMYPECTNSWETILGGKNDTICTLWFFYMSLFFMLPPVWIFF